MKLNFDDVTRTRWNSIIYNPALTSVRNENCNELFIDILTKNGFGSNQKYPNLHKCYDLIIDFFGIDKSTVIFGFGSDQMLKDLFTVLDYESIQIFDQSWLMANIYNTIFNKKILTNEFIFTKSNFYLKNSIREIGGDVLYVVNPHCPTGLYIRTESLLELSYEFKYIILDETYEHPLKFDKRLLERNNIIIVKSFSKLGGVPGMRIGYCIADKSIIDKMFVIKPLYEMCADAVKYLEFIMNPDGVRIIDEHIAELQKCFNVLKKINGEGFNVQGGNWGTFQDFNKFKGRNHVIDSLPIIRVTLTDVKNSKQLCV